MKHRYWTGLLLLIRVCLFLIFSLNTINDPTINLLAIVITIFVLFTYLSVIGGVYKVWWLNIIEFIFFLNLGILSAIGLYQFNVGTPMTTTSYTSSGIAFGCKVWTRKHLHEILCSIYLPCVHVM